MQFETKDIAYKYFLLLQTDLCIKLNAEIIKNRTYMF